MGGSALHNSTHGDNGIVLLRFCKRFHHNWQFIRARDSHKHKILLVAAKANESIYCAFHQLLD